MTDNSFLTDEIAPAFCWVGYDWNKSPTENDSIINLEFPVAIGAMPPTKNTCEASINTNKISNELLNNNA